MCVCVCLYMRAYIHVRVLQAWVPFSSTARPCLSHGRCLCAAGLNQNTCYSELCSPENKSPSICKQGRRGKGK